MKRQKIDSKVECQILTSLIVSTGFLSSSANVLREHLEVISSDHFRQIAEWCLSYFNQYGKAPGKHIEGIYYSWADKQDKHDEMVHAIHDFLEHLSGQYEQDVDLNVPYLLDSLADYLSLKKMTQVSNDLEAALSSGDRKAAEGALNGYLAPSLGEGVGINLFHDREAWKRAFQNPLEPLIEFEGDAGKFLNVALTRDALIGIQGPEKRGKTSWCVELVMRGLRARRKVALFEVGDLSESQIMMRFGMRLAGRPLRESDCGLIRRPFRINRLEEEPEEDEEEESPEGGRLRVKMEYKDKDCPLPVSRRAVMKACRSFLRNQGLSKKQIYLMTSVHANSSINIQGITGILDRWAHEKNFIPDIIVIDYADILAPEDRKKDARDQVNDTWKALRRLSQERHCLVIAPTQANRGSYTADVQQMHHASEDKRKIAHVTGMLGLNQNEAEKDAQVMRLNWIALRESDYNMRRCLYVGQCLKLGQSITCSML